MLTLREVRQRLSAVNMRVLRLDGEYRVTAYEWSGVQAENGAYYTDCIEDAYFTALDMRKRADAGAHPSFVPIR
jgi:hypothetical protein